MDKELIAEIARQIVNEEILTNGYLYLILALLIIGFGGLASYVVYYLRTQGKNLATKADFKNLLERQKDLTKATENIKQSIAHQDWVTREYKLVKRQKLEELITAIHDADEFIEQKYTSLIHSKEISTSLSPLKKVDLIGTLYFPELTSEINKFDKALHEYNNWILNLEKDVLAMLSIGDIQSAVDLKNNSLSNFEETKIPVIKAIWDIQIKAQNLMEDFLQNNTSFHFPVSGSNKSTKA